MKDNPETKLGLEILNTIESYILRHSDRESKEADVDIVALDESLCLYYDEPKEGGLGCVMLPLRLINKGGSPAWDINIKIEPKGNAPFNDATQVLPKRILGGGGENEITLVIPLYGRYHGITKPDKIELEIFVYYTDYLLDGMEQTERFPKHKKMSFTINYRKRKPEDIKNHHRVARFEQVNTNINIEREKINQFFEEHLNKVKSSTVLNFFGQRGVGKTALLSELQRKTRDKKLPETVCRMPDAEKLNQDDAFFVWLEPLIILCRSIDASMTKPDQKQFRSNPGRTSAELFEALEQILIKYCHDNSVVLMFDDIDLAQKHFDGYAPFEQFIKFLSTMADNHTDNQKKLIMVFLGTESLAEMAKSDKIRRWNDLERNAIAEEIQFFEENEVHKFIDKSQNGSEIHYDKRARKAIIEATAGHPYLMQLICYDLIESTKNSNYIRPLDFWDVERTSDCITRSNDHFRYIWDGMNYAQKWALYLIAEGLPSREHLMPVRKPSVLDVGKKLLDVYKPDLDFIVIINFLISKKIIKENVGILEFNIGLLERWICNNLVILKQELSSHKPKEENKN